MEGRGAGGGGAQGQREKGRRRGGRRRGRRRRGRRPEGRGEGGGERAGAGGGGGEERRRGRGRGGEGRRPERERPEGRDFSPRHCALHCASLPLREEDGAWKDQRKLGNSHHGGWDKKQASPSKRRSWQHFQVTSATKADQKVVWTVCLWGEGGHGDTYSKPQGWDLCKRERVGLGTRLQEAAGGQETEQGSGL